MTTELLDKPTFDQVEAALATCEQADLPVVHRFAPGVYCREIHIPAGVMATSAVHKSTHLFTISQGRIRVISETEGAVEYAAPYTGITEPGTRRMVLALEDVVWTTYHPTEKTDLAEIAEEILAPCPNPLLPAGFQPGWERDLKRIEHHD